MPVALRRARPEDEDQARGGQHEPDGPQQEPQHRRPERLPDMVLDEGLQGIEAAGGETGPDLAGRAGLPMTGAVPIEQVAPQLSVAIGAALTAI